MAEAFLAELRQAARRGEAFDVATGMAVSMLPPPEAMSWLAFAQVYVDVKWPRAAAKTRDSLTDALATVTAALVDAAAPDARLVRTMLRQYLLPPAGRDRPQPPEVEATARWLVRHSLPVTELTSPHVLRSALEALTLTLDGNAAPPSKQNSHRHMIPESAFRSTVPSNPRFWRRCDRPPFRQASLDAGHALSSSRHRSVRCSSWSTSASSAGSARVIASPSRGGSAVTQAVTMAEHRGAW